jgi:hypothetical protein
MFGYSASQEPLIEGLSLIIADLYLPGFNASGQ